MLLKVVSTESVALRLPRAVSQYFDFGRIETAPEEKGVVACVSAGIPRILFHWYQTVVTTYVGVALEIANVGGVKIEETEPVPDGAVRGAATLRFRWKIRWAAGG